MSAHAGEPAVCQPPVSLASSIVIVVRVVAGINAAPAPAPRRPYAAPCVTGVIGSISANGERYGSKGEVTMEPMMSVPPVAAPVIAAKLGWSSEPWAVHWPGHCRSVNHATTHRGPRGRDAMHRAYAPGAPGNG